MGRKRKEKRSDGFWPEDLVDDSVVPPTKILNEAAGELSRRTDGALTAEPTQIGEPQASELIYAFYLVAPSLRGLRYELFRVLVPAHLYPLELRGGVLDTSYEVHDADDFRTKLRDLFASGSARRIVSALVAESREQKGQE